MEHLKAKKILVSGACGSVGMELVRRLLSEKTHTPAAVVGLDNNESGLFYLDQRYLTDDRAQFFIGDICDRESLSQRMQGIDVVFHTAALKHVVLCERSPIDTVRTNIHGVQNIIETAGQAGVERVIFTSSDKAVNPVNVMGASKLVGERMMTAAAEQTSRPVYASIRFGNVFGSSGSVVPIFRRQIAQGGPVTLTDPDMLRFFMSVERSVELIIDSARVAQGGEVFVTKMPVVRIEDLAAVMIRELAPVYRKNPDDIEVRLIGAKPGEKLQEELMSGDEPARAIELDRYFAVLPEYAADDPTRRDRPAYAEVASAGPGKPYIASEQTPMDQATLTAFLRDNALLDHAVPD